MNNIQKPHKAIYFGLLVILFVLIAIVLYIPLPKFKKTNKNLPITNINSPTPINNSQLTINKSPSKPILVTPTGTGGMEDIPKNVADSATQKQNLKKILPFNQVYFAITFDYETDKFVVKINDPFTTNNIEFEKWLKNNYPLIPLQSFQIEK